MAANDPYYVMVVSDWVNDGMTLWAWPIYVFQGEFTVKADYGDGQNDPDVGPGQCKVECVVTEAVGLTLQEGLEHVFAITEAYSMAEEGVMLQSELTVTDEKQVTIHGKTHRKVLSASTKRFVKHVKTVNG